MQTERPEPDVDPAARLGRLWRGYAEKVYGSDYPLYRAIAGAVADDREVLDLLLSCRPEAHDPNMLLASIQYLVLGGSRHPLAGLYGRASTFSSRQVPGIADLVGDFCRRHRSELSTLLNSRHVQTNETGRCGGIALGLMEAVKLTGEPVALIDAGASAGLNLALDEYLLDFGDVGRMGPEDSPVRLRCDIRGTPPPGPLRLPAIASRMGIDRMPINLGDEDTVRWLLACIWPGTGRQDRARAAMALLAGRPSVVRQGDMLDGLGPALDGMHPAPTVVVTSWSYSYLPVEARRSFVDVLRVEGRRRPIAWVCCDLLGTEPLFDPPCPPPAAEGTPSVLGVAVFHGNRSEARAVAFMHSHGSWLSWIGATG